MLLNLLIYFLILVCSVCSYGQNEIRLKKKIEKGYRACNHRRQDHPEIV
jgi:hypothetical protein